MANVWGAPRLDMDKTTQAALIVRWLVARLAPNSPTLTLAPHTAIMHLLNRGALAWGLAAVLQCLG